MGDYTSWQHENKKICFNNSLNNYDYRVFRYYGDKKMAILYLPVGKTLNKNELIAWSHDNDRIYYANKYWTKESNGDIIHIPG